MATIKSNYHWLAAVFVAGFISTGANAAALGPCSVNDFTAGGASADACANGPTANDDLASVNTLFGGGWSMTAKYDKDDGPESGIALNIFEVDGHFGWSIPVGALTTFDDALFVVKQGNPNARNPGGWVSYLFEPLMAAAGEFFTSGSFAVNDYSHVTLYTRGEGGSQSVPEIDGAGAALALALLGGILALRRERLK